MSRMMVKRTIKLACVGLTLTSAHVAWAQEEEATPTTTSTAAAVPLEAQKAVATAAATSPEPSRADPQNAAGENSPNDPQEKEERAKAPPTEALASDVGQTDRSAPSTPSSTGDDTQGADPTSAAAQASAEANNPLSNLTSISFQDYKTLEVSQDTEATRDGAVSNMFYVRFAKSFGKRVILRASLPLVSTYNEESSGLGDMNVIVPILLNREDSPLKMGVGPLVNLPTHTDGLGADAWGLGLSATAFYMKSPVFQPGALVTWSYNLGADTPADEGNLITAQPFLFFQLGHGTYLRSSAVATLEFEHERYNVPVGLGIGQVVKQGRTVFNIYAEGQQTVWSYGALLPTSQLFFGLNIQNLPKKK